MRIGLVHRSLAIVACLLALSAARSALSQTVTIPDGANDSSHANAEAPLAAGAPGITPPGFLDIVRSELSKADDTFVFVMTVREPIPETMPGPGEISGAYLSHGAHRQLLWVLGISTDPAFPAGYPFSPPSAAPAEFYARVIWDGHAFTANIVDRRPLLEGGEATVTPIGFSVNGDEVTLMVGAELIGDPASFEWGSAITVVDGKLPSNGYVAIDHAPDAYPGLASWPD